MSIEEAVLKFKKIVYGDEDMFLQKFTELNINDGLTVFWTDNLMYVNDEYDGQATITTDLFSAYKFALLIKAINFDYEANDEDVKYLGEQLLTLCDENECSSSKIINIWDYFDDISDDFEKLTGRRLGIGDKRIIVANITEVGDENHSIGSLECWGSATFIASLLWKYVKGDELRNIQPCDNSVINELADEYLEADTYDLHKFAEELHKKSQETEPLTFKDLLHSLMKEKFNENDNPKIYVEIEKNIEAITEETPYGNIYQITGYRLDDDEDVYLSIK